MVRSFGGNYYVVTRRRMLTVVYLKETLYRFSLRGFSLPSNLCSSDLLKLRRPRVWLLCEVYIELMSNLINFKSVISG